jgi:hypothetical protein
MDGTPAGTGVPPGSENANGLLFGIIEIENPGAVPEPGSLILLGGVALAGYGWYRRRRAGPAPAAPAA